MRKIIFITILLLGILTSAQEFPKMDTFTLVPINAPVSPNEGQTYYDQTSKKMFVWNGTQWLDLAITETDNQTASEVSVTAAPSNYSAATADIEAHLAGIDTALGSVGGGGSSTPGPSTVELTDGVAPNTAQISGPTEGMVNLVNTTNSNKHIPVDNLNSSQVGDNFFIGDRNSSGGNTVVYQGTMTFADVPDKDGDAKGSNNAIIIEPNSYIFINEDIDGNALVEGSAFDWIFLDAQAPTAPSSLTSPSNTDMTINLSWTNGTDNVAITATEYRINGGPWTALVSGNGTTGTITGLTASTTYNNIEVRHLDAAGNVSSGSNTINVTTDGAITNVYSANDAAHPTNESDTVNAAYWFEQVSGASPITSSATNPRTGSYNIRITRNASNVTEPDLRLPVTQNTTYDFSLWIAYDDNGSGDSAELRVRTGNGATSNATINLTDTGSTYQEYTFSVTIETEVTLFDLGFKFNGNNSGNWIDVDDIVIQPQ